MYPTLYAWATKKIIKKKIQTILNAKVSDIFLLTFSILFFFVKKVNPGRRSELFNLKYEPQYSKVRKVVYRRSLVPTKNKISFQSEFVFFFVVPIEKGLIQLPLQYNGY